MPSAAHPATPCEREAARIDPSRGGFGRVSGAVGAGAVLGEVTVPVVWSLRRRMRVQRGCSLLARSASSEVSQPCPIIRTSAQWPRCRTAPGAYALRMPLVPGTLRVNSGWSSQPRSDGDILAGVGPGQVLTVAGGAGA